MKLEMIEKFIITSIIIAAILWIISIFNVVTYINDKGGVKPVIVEIGKEVKNIIKEIQED